MLTLTTDPDHETQAQYNFAGLRDAAGNSSERQPVILEINDVDDAAPTVKVPLQLRSMKILVLAK